MRIGTGILVVVIAGIVSTVSNVAPRKSVDSTQYSTVIVVMIALQILIPSLPDLLLFK